MRQTGIYRSGIPHRERGDGERRGPGRIARPRPPAAGRALRLGVSALAAAALSGCGLTYTSPRVDPADDSLPVTVVALTAATVHVANRSAYTPRALPDAFRAVAGQGSLRGTGALPAAPEIPEVRHAALETRLPPDIAPGPYRIGVGDVVLLATRGSASTVEQLSGLLAAQSQRQGYTVRGDGAIAIPEVGAVKLAGMTVEEAEDKLFQVLVENRIDPSFSLEVAEFNSRRIAVGGAVGAPGLVPVTLQPPRLAEVLAAAGGLTAKDEEYAALRIYRDGALYQIPLATYFARPALHDTLLADGDAVYVDTTWDLDRAMTFYRQRLDAASLRSAARRDALEALETEIGLQRAALAERRTLFEARTALDAEARDYVYLAGEVRRQARVALPYGRQASLADVLYEQGGFDTTTGDPAEIYVLRASGGAGAVGEIVAYHLDAENVANIVIATRMQMRPNDVVFIEEQQITKWSRSLQQMFPAMLSAAAN